MRLAQRLKRGHALDRGRGVTAASLAFNQAGVGSNPSDPNDTRACSSTGRAGSLSGPDDGSTPSGPTEDEKRDQGASGSILGSYPEQVTVQVRLIPLGQETRAESQEPDGLRTRKRFSGSRLLTLDSRLLTHWSSSGEDSALVTRQRGFDSHPVLFCSRSRMGCE
jgi:hypothetical protein